MPTATKTKAGKAQYLEPSPIRKIGFDLMALVDLEETRADLMKIWYGDHEPLNEPTLQDYGVVLFRHAHPRPGALGVLRDLRMEGAVLMFFTDITDPNIGEQATLWLQEWTGVRDIVLHQFKNPETMSPVRLDCQAYILAEGHAFIMPEGRPRVREHSRGGDFNRELIDEVRKV